VKAFIRKFIPLRARVVIHNTAGSLISLRNTVINQKTLRMFKYPFELVDFGYVEKTADFDLKWDFWSRVYEYELVLNNLEKYGCSTSSYIHNSCWGWQGTHVLFKNQLDEKYGNVIHSDVKVSKLPKTSIYDVTVRPPQIWRDKFDFVINVSTVEEINYSHIKVIENLLAMVNSGGYLIVTFDLPGMQLDSLENLFNSKLPESLNPITPANSVFPMPEYGSLKVAYFVIKRK